ncbi:nitrate reductase NarX [Mycobacterium tuberculosis]|nr:nitrate reductase NarX [Mycobacterium tuberculosis]
MRGQAANLVLATWISVVNFWAWNLIGPLSTSYARDMSLSSAEASLLVATPILVGALGRIVTGPLTDRFGGRAMLIAVTLASILPVLAVGVAATMGSYALLVFFGLFLGVAGTIFAVGIPFANNWYQPARRGFSTGVFGMGMVGTALSAFFTPRFVRWFGLFTTHAIVAAALASTAVVAMVVLRDAPYFRPNADPVLPRLKAAARLPVTWEMSFLYAIVFGGFVAFSNYLPTYITTIYGFSTVDAGARTAGFALAAVLLTYPNSRQLGTAEELLAHIDGPAADLLGRTVSELRRADPLTAATRYVDTFDLRGRATLYLTYWTAGDTRNRGREMLAFAQTYRSTDVAPPRGETPDFLPVVLEFAATVDPEAGRRLLSGYRVPIAALCNALTEAALPYAHTVAAVCRTGDMMGELFWTVVPYVTMTIVAVGSWWRYRYDKFGWTTRSSQLYESRLLRIASPMFHFGILVVIVGHGIGLVIPQSWTQAAGLSEGAYHVQAVVLGSIAGITTLAGVTLLIYRRRTRGPVFMATTVNDKVMYLVLVAAIVAGLGATALGSGVVGEAYNYRETVSVWFRSVWVLQPRGDLMAEAPLYYQIHVLIGLALFALWPFTRLVHAFSAPIGYLFRPYIIYRSREELVLTRPRRRGW